MNDHAPTPTPPRNLVSRLADRVAFIGALIAGVAVVGVMLAVTIDVVMRNLGGRPIAGVTDRVEVTLAFVVFLALAYTQLRNEHVAVEAVVNRTGPRTRKFLNVLAFILSLVAVALLAWAATRLAIRQTGIRETRIGIAEVAIWPSRIAAAVGLWMWSLQYLAAAFTRMKSRSVDDDGSVYAYGPL